MVLLSERLRVKVSPLESLQRLSGALLFVGFNWCPGEGGVQGSGGAERGEDSLQKAVGLASPGDAEQRGGCGWERG